MNQQKVSDGFLNEAISSTLNLHFLIEYSVHSFFPSEEEFDGEEEEQEEFDEEGEGTFEHKLPLQ